MKKILKNPVMTFALGLAIATTVGVSASILYQANEIGFTPRNSNWKVNNLESALDDLYTTGGTGINLNNVYWDFSAASEEQAFKVPSTGNYKLEVWGAQGGSYNETYYGGYGGYSVGTVHLDKDETLYVNVGGVGTSSSVTGASVGGYNGGGQGYTWSYGNVKSTSGGGGATHIAKVSGTLDQLEQYKGEYSEERKTYNSDKILIVAGGGGGSMYYYQNGSDWQYSAGGSGGGYIGNEVETATSNYTITNSQGGTQSQGGSGGKTGNPTFNETGTFGHGGIYGAACNGGSAGGSGFYGGGGGCHIAGAGGSGYIGSSLLTNKHMTCYNCTESNDEHIKTQTVSNKSETPKADYAKIGNGFARITYIGN